MTNNKNIKITILSTIMLVILLMRIPLHAISETNNQLKYSDLTAKDLTIAQLEDLYYLRLSKRIRLTGENLIDLNNFSSIERVRTYTAIKVEF